MERPRLRLQRILLTLRKIPAIRSRRGIRPSRLITCPSNTSRFVGSMTTATRACRIGRAAAELHLLAGTTVLQFFACSNGSSSGQTSLGPAETACGGGASSVFFPDLRRDENFIDMSILVKF